ncbi:MAG: STAS/SEC14 domain-containing protein [Bacteroidota bacterium]
MEPQDKKDFFESPLFDFWTEYDGKLLVLVSKDEERTVERYEPMIAIMQKLTENGNKICMLSDSTNSNNITKEMRDYLDDQVSKYVKALALFSDSVMGEAMTLIYSTLRDSSFPVKSCTNEQSAREWLQSYIESNESSM